MKDKDDVSGETWYDTIKGWNVFVLIITHFPFYHTVIVRESEFSDILKNL